MNCNCAERAGYCGLGCNLIPFAKNAFRNNGCLSLGESRSVRNAFLANGISSEPADMRRMHELTQGRNPGAHALRQGGLSNE
jgi:hypothetical protein